MTVTFFVKIKKNIHRKEINLFNLPELSKVLSKTSTWLLQTQCILCVKDVLSISIQPSHLRINILSLSLVLIIYLSIYLYRYLSIYFYFRVWIRRQFWISPLLAVISLYFPNNRMVGTVKINAGIIAGNSFFFAYFNLNRQKIFYFLCLSLSLALCLVFFNNDFYIPELLLCNILHKIWYYYDYFLTETNNHL